jgi:hypothetical protein
LLSILNPNLKGTISTLLAPSERSPEKYPEKKKVLEVGG